MTFLWPLFVTKFRWESCLGPTVLQRNSLGLVLGALLGAWPAEGLDAGLAFGAPPLPTLVFPTMFPTAKRWYWRRPSSFLSSSWALPLLLLAVAGSVP